MICSHLQRKLTGQTHQVLITIIFKITTLHIRSVPETVLKYEKKNDNCEYERVSFALGLVGGTGLEGSILSLLSL